MTGQQEVMLLQLLNALKTNQDELLLEIKHDMTALIELFGGVVRSIQTIESLVLKLRVQQEEMAQQE